MTVPYTIEDLDALITACIEFTDEHGRYFMVGNIAGRSGVNSDLDAVRQMMDWVSETDKGILEYSGIGTEKVPYFRIGRNAKKILEEGGFKKYVSRRRRVEVLDQIRLWAPICISLLALVVSILAWRAPQGRERVDEVNKRLDQALIQIGSLKAAHEQLGRTVAMMQSNPDARLSPPGSAKTRREP
jgi:hypothetical protein